MKYYKHPLKSFIVVSIEMFGQLLFCLPRYKTFNFFKKIFLILLGARVGRSVTFYPHVWIMPGRNLVVGDNVDFALGVIVTTSGGVHIGDRVLIGYRSHYFHCQQF